MNEIEAHQWEIDNIDKTGFSAGYLQNLKMLDEHMNMLSNTNYWEVKFHRYIYKEEPKK